MQSLDAPASSARPRELLDRVAAGILVTDREGIVVAVNRATASMLGYEREELLGKDLRDLFHPDEAANRRSSSAGGADREVSVRRRLRHKSGEFRITEGSAQTMDDGRVLHVVCDVTQIAATERALTEEVEQLRFVANAVPALIGYVDANTRYVWANESYARWFGYPPDRVRGRHASDVLGPTAWKAVRPYVERALAGEEVTFAHRLDYTNGPARDVRATYTPHLDSHGRVRGFVGMVHDVTELRTTELALRRRDYLFEQSQSTAHVGSWELNLEDGALTWSDETYRIFGYQPGAITVTQAMFLDAVHPEDRERLRATAREVHDHGEGFEVEYRLVRPDGTVRLIHSWTHFELDADGKPFRMIGAVQDITERKLAEQESRRAREELELVMDATAASIARYDAERRIVWTNKSNAARVGKPPEQIVGRALREIEGEAAYRALEPSIDRVLHGETVELETEVPHPTLGPRWVHLVYSPTFDVKGKPDGWVSVLTDNTQRRELERALRSSEERALVELREADRRKDEFLAMLSHELRNPLSPILSAVELLERAGPGADDLRARYQNVIVRQVLHMKRLLDDLLDVSRVSQGKIQLRLESIDLSAVLLQAVEVSRPLIIEKRLRLSMNLSPGPLPLHADPTRLVQVFANLINNAAKYTDEGGHIAVEVAPENGDAVVKVRDDGMGMRPELLARAFDLFVQETRSLDRAQGGLGIGLTMVRTLVNLHGGSVRGYSDGPGRGSEFAVTLPLSRQVERPKAKSIPPPESAADRGLRVLVVDDNKDAATALGELLEMSGHVIELAHDGPAALTAAASMNPEVVLLDIGLPGMDGYAVAARLREAGHDRSVLIAITGYGQDEYLRRSSETRFDHHLVKPIDFNVLRCLISRLGRERFG